MSGPQDNAEPMTQADMATLESALRNGWAIPDESCKSYFAACRLCSTVPNAETACKSLSTRRRR